MVKDNLSVVLVVASGELDQELDLEEQKEKLSDNFYEAYLEKPGLYAQREEDSPTITLFPSGKYIIRADNKEELYKEDKQLSEQFDMEYEKDNLNISNMVGNLELEGNLKLNPLAINLGLENIEYYEPEQFPALSYKHKDSKYSCTFLVFSTGRIVVTGGKKRETMEEATEEFIKNVKDNEENFF